MDIHKGLGNANKLMNRVLDRLGSAVRLAHLDGGGLRNAIPRESVALVVVTNAMEAEFKSTLTTLQVELAAEHGTTDPNLELVCEPITNDLRVVQRAFQESLITALYANPNGIYRMSPDIEGLVQTSNNTARVLLEDGQLTVLCLTRSSVESEKIAPNGLIGILTGNTNGRRAAMADSRVPLFKTVSTASSLHTQLL